MACVETGRLPYFLAAAIAMAFDYVNPEDPDSLEVSAFLREHGIREAVQEYCGLHIADDKENLLIQLICGHYAALHLPKVMQENAEA